MTEKKIEVDKAEIQKLGLSSIKNYFLVDPSEIESKDVLQHLLMKAKLGMQFEKEMNVSKRASESNKIRIFKLTANDKKEFKTLVKKSLPNYLPA